MKLLVNLLAICWISFIWSDPLLVVVIMVKNEAQVIEATLQPFVESGVTDFVVLDTGSTDGTQEVAASFFKKHAIENAHIIEEPFVDFAVSRNYALDQTQRLFPHATFMCMPDAEWYIHNVEGLLQFCNDHQDDMVHPYYLVSIRSTTEAFYHSRLIRCSSRPRFCGATQEAMNIVCYEKVPDDVYFEWRPSQQGNQKSRQRWLRDRDLLLKDYKENPHNPRVLFYLGQTYECLGDWENAYLYYQKRAEIKGWDEENFAAIYRLGRVAPMLSSQNHKSLVPLALEHYFKAFSLRPQRIEPLVQLASYYISIGEMDLAFLFASRAIRLSYPKNDILFVEKYMYDFVRYDLLGICAWYVGEYAIGEWAVKQALQVEPEAKHLQANLKLYMDRALL